MRTLPFFKASTGARLLLSFGLALGLVSGAALTTPAHATSIAPLTTEQLTDASDAVVRGTVLRMRVELDAQSRPWTRVDVRVDRVLKGQLHAGEIVTVESPGGVLGDGTVVNVDAAARYSIGEEAILFLSYKPSRSVYGTVGMFLGKYTIRQDSASGQPMVVRYTASYARPYDARFLPPPPADQRVMLVDLEAQIQSRVTVGWDGQPIPGISSDRLRTINNLQGGVR